jgi:aminomethyltransferase
MTNRAQMPAHGKLDREHFRTAVYETPFHPRTSELNVLNEWHRWKDYTTADAFFDEALEYSAIRNAAAVFDLTPMTKHRITGPDALAFLNRLVTRDVAKLKPGRVGYCVWCDDNGQVIDDGTIFHLRDGDYRLCSQERQLEWLMRSAIGFDVSIVEDTHDVAALALQGPTSCAVLRKLGLPDIENLPPFGIAFFDFAGSELMVSRTGFTGDLGYEVWIEPARALDLWDGLFEAGRDHGIRPMGTHALEVARIEAGFIQAGVDFHPADQAVRTDRSRSPFELDLAWLVDFKKPNFNGRRALLEEQRRGSRYRFVRLDIEGNKPAKSSYIYDGRRNVVGTVTSAEWSPSAKANIALASLEMPWDRPADELYAEIYYQRELKWSRVMARCRVVAGAFWDPPRRRATPAADF